MVPEKSVTGRQDAAETHQASTAPISVARMRAFAGPVSLERRKKLLESSLVNWIFYEDLSDEQRAVLDRVFQLCCVSNGNCDRSDPVRQIQCFAASDFCRNRSRDDEHVDCRRQGPV
jgi:hypothetical protein